MKSRAFIPALFALALLPLLSVVRPTTAAPGVIKTQCQKNANREETRCGWIDNPTPGNWWIEDQEGTWTISIQGSYAADGELPDFGSEWVKINGYYGYGCGCMKATIDRSTNYVLSFSQFRVLPLQRCRADRHLKQRQ